MHASLLTRSAGYVDLARLGRKLRSGDDAVRANARLHLAARMGRLRGLPQKIGQILSMSDDPDLAAPFAPLKEDATPLPFEEIKPILCATWGRDISDVLASIDPRGRAASIGQVHRAVLHDGRAVAIKSQYPGIRRAIRSDLRMLGWLSAPLGNLRRGFDLTGYRREILRDLEEELDYRIEAEHQRRFHAILGELPGWTIPTILPELCGDRVLVSEWLDGDGIEIVEGWPKADRDALAASLIQGFFRLLFHHGVVHADPHPGNYRFVKTPAGPKIILFDFGSVAKLPSEHLVALLKLIEISVAKEGDPYKPFISMGFNDQLLSPIRSKLPAVCSTLFEPFCSDGKYDVKRWRLSERVADILGEDRWNFRMSGPPNLIFLLRAFRGLIYYLEKLSVNVSWRIALAPHLAAHRAALDSFDTSTPIKVRDGFARMARHLRIRVTHQGHTKVFLTFRSDAVDNLDELMDDEIKNRVRTQGIDLPAIVRRVRQTIYAPQDLFRIEESGSQRGVRVWLE